MNSDVTALATKARRSVANARLSLAAGDADFAASRAYYAMFYAAEALLLSLGLSFSKHSAVIAEFNREFVHKGRLAAALGTALQEAFDERLVADYGVAIDFPASKAQRLIEQAEAFLNAADEWLRRQTG